MLWVLSPARVDSFVESLQSAVLTLLGKYVTRPLIKSNLMRERQRGRYWLKPNTVMDLNTVMDRYSYGSNCFSLQPCSVQNKTIIQTSHYV